MTRLNHLAVLLAGTMLAGCTLAPDFMRPDLPVAASYPQGPAYRLAGTQGQQVSADSIGWRDFFTDPKLVELIDIALKNNRDLRVAALNVGASQAQFRVQRSDLFPTISASGNAEYVGEPSSTVIPTSSGGQSSTSALQKTAAGGGTYRYYTASVGFTSYELDVFGRIRSLSRKAYEQYLSDAETQRSTQISLVAQVGSAYLTYLSDQDLLRISRETFDSQSNSYNLTKAMADAGTTTALSLRQAQTSVETARANIAQYTRQVAQDENALTLLLGEPIPADLPVGKTLDTQGLLADLPAGLPSELVQRRPDVLAAEHTLIGANANIGAARAAFFPSISLTASGGAASNQLGRLFTNGAGTWSFAPTINIPIFTFGQNQGNLDLAKTQKQIEVANYEKAIQTAFREVADALAARTTYRDQIAAQQALVDAAADAYRLSDLRFRAGVDTFLNALDSQRTLYSAQQTLVNLKLSEETNLVTLYKALGGGWQEKTAVASAQPPQ